MKNFSYKYRIYPTKEQQEKIWININGARYVYNALLADTKEQYESSGKSKIKNVTSLYEDYKNLFLKECDQNALGYARRHLESAYKNFFREVKKHQKVGFPKFKSYYRASWSYSTAKNTKSNNIKVAEGKIKLPKISPIKIVLHRELPKDCRIISVTISETRSGKYYASIGVEVPDDYFENIDYHTGNSVGLDLGVKDFVITSDGDKYPNLHALNKAKKQLVKVDRALARKAKGSHGRIKAKIKRAKAYEHLQNQRKVYIHQVSKDIVTKYDSIGIEDLNVKGMLSNHKLAKAVSDVSLYEFTRQLEYKADWYGKKVIKVDRFYPSSQTCNSCGYRLTGDDKLTLSDREWTCPKCGTHHDRDINAAKNILDTSLTMEK